MRDTVGGGAGCAFAFESAEKTFNEAFRLRIRQWCCLGNVKESGKIVLKGGN
jgi:hypothetical protein